MNRSRCSLLPLLLAFFLLAPLGLAAQETATLNGYVTDAENQETLVGAVIRIAGGKLGGTTNTSGYFNITKIPPGRRKITVSYIGYEKQELTLDLSAGESRRITVSLKPQPTSSRDVIVRAERDEDDPREITISRVNIPVEQLNQIRIGGEADVFRSLQFLPGVLTSSQVSSGLFIRGGSPDQNLVLLDGSTVYNPSHLFGFFSTFNPDAIKDVELIKGGYPAEYGGRLSAVLNITQKDGNRNEVEGVGSIGVISSRLSLQGPIGDGSWFIGGRRTYLDLILSLVPEDPENPLPSFAFYDVNAKITQDIGPNDRISFSGFTSDDDLVLDGAGLGFTIGIGNLTGAARWTHIFDDGLFSIVNLSASKYRNGFKGDNSGYQFEIGNNITDYTGKGSLEWYASDDLTIKGGVEASRYEFEYLQNFTGNTDEGSGSQSEGKTELTVTDWTSAAFAQVNYAVTDLLSMQAGVHADYADLSETFTIDPRIAFSYRLQPEIVLKGSFGIFHQYLRLASVPDFSFFDTWLPTDSTVVPSDATHYILGLETEPFDGYDFNIDAYYKTMHNISELNELATRAETVAEIFYSGDGTAYGVELFLQKKRGDLTGWLGYALGYVNARFDSVNGGREFRPKYDRRHDMKVVAQYRLNDRWEFGASFTFQTGQSYTAASSRFRSTFPGETIGTDMTVPADRYALRLPPSHQLNISANYSTTLFDLPARLLIDIFNVYSRRDIWFRYYDTAGDVTTVTDVKLLPIIPTVSFEVKF